MHGKRGCVLSHTRQPTNPLDQQWITYVLSIRALPPPPPPTNPPLPLHGRPAPRQAMLEHATGQPRDGVVAHCAHGAVSRPRPRMEKLGRKGRGGRGGYRWDGRRRVPHTRIPVSHPLCTHPSPPTPSLTSQAVHPRTCSHPRVHAWVPPRISCHVTRAGGQSSADEVGDAHPSETDSRRNQSGISRESVAAPRARAPCEAGLHD